MEKITKTLEEKCGASSSSIHQSILQTSKILDTSTIEVCISLLEKLASASLRVISWNLLADIWYGDVPSTRRFKKILSTLKGLINKYDPDIILLQEVTESKYLTLVKELRTYSSNISYHESFHWKDQLKAPYQPNGTGIFVKKKLGPVIFSSVSLGGGNVAGAIKFMSADKEYKFHITNVHLNDKDIHYIREQEISKILGLVDSSITYIIGGDLNSRPSSQVHRILKTAGFETVCFIECDIDYIYSKRGEDVHQILMIPMITPTDETVEKLIETTGSDHPPIGTIIYMF